MGTVMGVPVQARGPPDRVKGLSYRVKELPYRVKELPDQVKGLQGQIKRFPSRVRSKRVRTTHSQSQCVVFRDSMRPEIEAEFQWLKTLSNEFSKVLRLWEINYKWLRQSYYQTQSRDWTVAQWDEFIFLENCFFNYWEEFCKLQDELQNLSGLLHLFPNKECLQPPSPSSCDIYPSDDGDVIVWSLEGKTKRPAIDEEEPVLEWNGVDYNVWNPVYELA